VVFSKYDEFPGIMWHVPTAAVVAASKKLQQVFGTDAQVVPGQIYGDVTAGTARVLHTPAITHPMDHISPTAIGHSVDWFQRTLQGGTPRPADDQTWYWKEFGTFIALIGLALFIPGVVGTLLTLPFFASLRSEVTTATPASRNAQWWTSLVLGALVPAATFLPLCRLGGMVLPASPLFPQLFSNEVAFWVAGDNHLDRLTTTILAG
jgi:hypothetical protein